MKEAVKTIVVKILTLEAKILLKRHKPKIVAVTGSVGKTSTKDAIYTVLKDHVKARKNQKSFNTAIGVPLTVLGLQTAWNNPWGWFRNVVEGLYLALFSSDYPEVLVLEAGVDRPGDMGELTAWLKPDVVVMTRLPNVPTHVEYFASPEEMVVEKLELVKALRDDGVFIYNNDDEKIVEVLENIRQQAFGYSRYSNSHFRVSGDKLIYDGSSPIGLDFNLRNLDESVKFSVRGSIGVQHAYNFAAAVAVGKLFGVTLTDAAEALRKHIPPAGRMRLLNGVNDSVIIDDSYNSSPVACERALLTLGEVKNRKRKIAVLGDMLELGQFSVREHERMGELAAENTDLLLTVGVRARKIAEGALECGLSEKSIWQYERSGRAAEELREMLKPGDIVLVKASQGVRAEKIVEKIMAEPQKAKELLVRQDVHWT